ncbi:uncharacterized protein PADG_12490 [Paracoccidioides brasiliensis Pb18]|uniref:CCHC-type domain-containing protein n=1 Tax=Paracoccidioides brasiliensis (strain Pb18) TaxID=502780 RepID=A0A0A0HSX3_PARBD|nr:uncharacterized protein PADG_12490 [Paracoccidioides brasiliensis Pb18]KGM91418.1 hypothetical protein PADG_12490 [Paracoccidioides brasiliensis Pb18]
MRIAYIENQTNGDVACHIALCMEEDYKTDFNDKLFFDLQRMVATINATQKSKSLQGNESNIFKQNTLWVSDSQTSHSISATKSSIIKKALDTHSDIQCYYCKKKDHIARNCSVKQKSQQMITELTENDTSESSADLRKEKFQKLPFKCCMKGYNDASDEVIDCTLTLNLWVNGWRFRNVPLLMMDLGQYSVILG